MKKGSILLLLTACIWGMAFVAQSVAMDAIGPWTFTCLRSYIAGLTLTCILPLFKKTPCESKMLWKGGITCGLCLGVASMLQQVGVVYTTVGKAGFITALYVVFVPLISVFLGKKIPKKIGLCVAMSVVGLYFLCMNESISFSKGDTFVLLCAVGFAFHILTIDHFSSKVDGIRMSCIQFYVAGLLCTIPMFVFEKPELSSIVQALGPVLYAGILSSGAGYTLQIIGQKDTDPTIASLLMSLESVFAAIGGFLLLHQVMSVRELIGCALTFGAVLAAQLPVEKLFSRK